MLELRAFGGLDLRDDAGTRVSAVLAHPKRSALLVYLALAQPRGTHRRDTLVALLWPESSQELARASLRKAVHNLRRVLGDDAIVGAGDEELALDDRLVWCDAVAFEREIDAGNTAAALELYRGHLLDGFFLSESPELERWIEQERARLRGRAFDAAWREAERAAGTAGAIDAAVWGRRAAALVPDDEGALRRLLALLDRIGDRAGAIGAYEDFARHLLRDYDAAPAAETQLLMREIRGRMTGASEPAPSAPRVMPPPPSVVIAQTTVPSKRRRWEITAAIAVVSSLILLASAWRARSHADTRTVTRKLSTVAVLPFSFRGARELSYLHDGMASLLATSLDGTGGFDSVDPSAMLGVSSSDPASGIDPARAGEVASRVGAGSFVVGEIIETDGRLSVSAAMYTATPTPRLLARAAGDDTTSQILALVDRLVAQLVTRQPSDSGQRLTRLAAVTTSSLPALKAYLEGEQRFRIGHYKEAVDAFSRAVEEDSTFALAHYRLASAYSWSGDTLMRQEAHRATRFAQRLTPSDRALVEAFLPYVEGQSDEAERRYRAILSTRPYEGEAWYPLGEVLFHFNPVRGRSIEEARPAFRRAISLGPSDAPLTHLLEIEAIAGDYAAFDSLLPGIAAGAHFDLVGRTIHAFRRRDEAARRHMLAEIRGVPDLELANVARHMLFLLDDRASAEEVVSVMLDAERPREVRALGHILIAHLEASAGRMRAADSALRLAASFDRLHALEHRALLESLPFLPTSRDALDATRAQLEHWSADSATGPAVVFMGDAQLHEPIRDYLLAVVYAALDRPADAERVAARLSRARVPAESQPLVVALSHGARARAALQKRDPSAALRELQERRDDASPVNLVGVVPFFGLASERFIHAEALRTLGRDEEALSWYGAFGEHSAYSRIFLAPAHRRRGEIFEKTGHRAEAVREYSRFVALWKDCDPALRPDVADAEARLKRLRTAEGEKTAP
jgi:DNA-binding SARP family transcriptional activator/Flp pilus assembly protein TadD